MRVDLRLRLRALQLLQLRLRPLLAEGLLGFGAQRLVRLVLAMLPGKLLAPFGTPTSFSRPLVERPRRPACACLLRGMTKTPPRRASMLPASDGAILCVLPLARECWLSGMSMEPSWQSVEGSPVGRGRRILGRAAVSFIMFNCCTVALLRSPMGSRVCMSLRVFV